MVLTSNERFKYLNSGWVRHQKLTAVTVYGKLPRLIFMLWLVKLTSGFKTWRIICKIRLFIGLNICQVIIITVEYIFQYLYLKHLSRIFMKKMICNPSYGEKLHKNSLIKFKTNRFFFKSGYTLQIISRVHFLCF